MARTPMVEPSLLEKAKQTIADSGLWESGKVAKEMVHYKKKDCN